jgi:hypothetical protein
MSLAPHLLPTALDLIAADTNVHPLFRAAVRSPRFVRGTDENLELRREEDSRADDARGEIEGDCDE